VPLGELEARRAIVLQVEIAAVRQGEAGRQQAQASQQLAQTRLAESGEALAAAQENLAAAEQRFQASEDERLELTQARARVDAEMARLRAQLDVLEQAEASLTGYASGTRLLLEAAHQERLSGARGALNNFLEVPAELETAISAALGEFLDAVLLEGDPDRALDLLVSDSARGVLLPLVQIRPLQGSRLAGSADPDVLGVAARLVEAPPEVRPALDLFLGQVYVVRDRRAARRLLAGEPSGVRAVTLQGEVFHASGPVQTSGLGSKSGDQTILGLDGVILPRGAIGLIAGSFQTALPLLIDPSPLLFDVLGCGQAQFQCCRLKHGQHLSGDERIQDGPG